MSNDSYVMALLEEGNPATELGEHAWSHLDAAAYLATLHERSSEVTQLDTKETQAGPKGAKRIPVLVAALLVVIVGVAVILTIQGGDETPITEPTPTTQVDAAPTTVVAEPDPGLDGALAAATALVRARADRDFHLASELAVEGRFLGFQAGSLERLPDEFAWQDAVGWSIEIEECFTTDSDIDRARVTCQVAHSTAVSRALGVGPYQGEYHMTVSLTDGSGSGDAVVTVADARHWEFPEGPSPRKPGNPSWLGSRTTIPKTLM